MSSSTTFDEPYEFDVGDHVVTSELVGPIWRRIRVGTSGVVVGRTVDSLVLVRFSGGRVEKVHPSCLEPDLPNEFPGTSFTT